MRARREVLITAFVGSLILSLLTAITISLLLGGDGRPMTVITIVALVQGAFLIFIASGYWWFAQRTTVMRMMTRNAQSVASGSDHIQIAGTRLQGELGELALAFEQMRQSLVAQRESLEQQKILITEILNGMGEGLLAINREKRVVLANSRVAELFDVRGPIVDQPFLEVVRNTALVAAFDLALAGQRSSDQASIGPRGAERWIEMRAFPLSSPSDIAAVALFIDVSRVQQLETIRRDFLADFSHEVRTPLAGLRSAAETFDSGAALSPEDEEHLLKIILRQVARLERLLQDVTELNRIESGELVLQKDRVNVTKLLRDLCDDFKERALTSGTRLVVSGDEALMTADPGKVQQIFSNLIDNALKHAGRPDEVRIWVRDQEDEIVVSVADKGVGIRREEQERIFNRFYRVDKSRSQERPGTGLGLSITKHLVLIHGGRISVESDPGRGTTFHVRLPKGLSPSRNIPAILTSAM